jgi:3'-phosphoadenosine 5'-phosphosulfate sulfotransferase (PAPS reductase)/FAD synthetase
VTWIEWLRRAGWITAPAPKLVRSDTGVEEQNLVGVAGELTAILERCGWECALVRPAIHERLYNRILGIGNSPIHPAIRRMRWCTRATKIDPMERWRGGAVGLTLTGLRMGESDMRDDKIRRSSCAAGGECGIPDPGEGKFSPILHWKTCQVVDWLSGHVGDHVRSAMADVFAVTKLLVELYNFATAKTLFDEEILLQSARFGCVGCPAIGEGPQAPASVARRYGVGHPICELYDVWHEARLPANRCVNLRKGKVGQPGPIRMTIRQHLFTRVMDIQRRASIVLVTPDDEAFIRQCWANKVYPRGWSEADEAVPMPAGPLFDHLESHP